jgi:hypothetical protein
LATLPFTLSWLVEAGGVKRLGRRFLAVSRTRAALLSAATLAAALLALGAFPPPDGWLTPLGLGPVFAPGGPLKAAGPLGWPWVWPAIGLAGAASFFLLATGIESPEAGARALLWGFAPLLAWLAAGGYFTDRYLLPFLAAAIALAARRPAGRVAWVLVALIGVVSAAATLDLLQWNQAFAAGAAELVAQGVPSDRVTGTIAWTAERNYQPEMDALKKTRPLGEIDDTEWFGRFQDRREAVVSFSPSEPAELFRPAGRVDYWCPWTLKNESVWLYRTVSGSGVRP